MLCILWTMYKNIISEILEDRLDELNLFWSIPGIK